MGHLVFLRIFRRYVSWLGQIVAFLAVVRIEDIVESVFFPFQREKTIYRSKHAMSGCE